MVYLHCLSRLHHLYHRLASWIFVYREWAAVHTWASSNACERRTLRIDTWPLYQNRITLNRLTPPTRLSCFRRHARLNLRVTDQRNQEVANHTFMEQSLRVDDNCCISLRLSCSQLFPGCPVDTSIEWKMQSDDYSIYFSVKYKVQAPLKHAALFWH